MIENSVNLTTLLNGIEFEAKNLPDNMAINHAVLDSRKVRPRDIFVAIKGKTSNGLDYIDAAAENGASAVLIDSSQSRLNFCAALPVISVKQLHRQLSIIADNCYASPSSQMTLVAVTGTNGKTTCAHLIAQALKILTVPVAVIGTAGQGLIGDLSSTSLTTPDIFELRKLLQRFKKQQVEAVVFEASSHGIEQGRLESLSIDLAVFTNLSHDHLDYHDDLESYANAKLKLFQFPGLNNAVMNGDSPLVENFASRTSASNVWLYGSSSLADVQLTDYLVRQSGLQLNVKSNAGEFKFESGLVGKINVENLLAVFTTLLAYGFEEGQICEAMPKLVSVPGRMEVFGASAGLPMVIVDYAHTPDALEKALLSLVDHVQGKLFCVFGCGGNRDVEKRPKMGAIAEKYAHVCVVTDDNPRHEKSSDIIADIIGGMKQNPIIISDRVKAIDYVIKHACLNDIVLIAGKGHETTQQVGNDFFDLSDRDLVNTSLRSLN